MTKTIRICGGIHSAFFLFGQPPICRKDILYEGNNTDRTVGAISDRPKIRKVSIDAKDLVKTNYKISLYLLSLMHMGQRLSPAQKSSNRKDYPYQKFLVTLLDYVTGEKL